MSKNVKDLHWKPVALEGFPITDLDFQGFIGLEECTDYGLDKESNKPKKKNAQKSIKSPPAHTPDTNTSKQKHKSPSESKDLVYKEVPNKKVKLSNGFVVESCNKTIPSHANCLTEPNNKKQSKKDKKKQKTELESEQAQESSKNARRPETDERDRPQLTAEDMLAWAEFKLPEPILCALTELGFKTPTRIQQLTLPAAIHGRKDILGAAETGSGKTLAFGLPILTGILKLKEEAATKGVNVYDIPYKKSSTKKKKLHDEEPSEKLKKDKMNRRQSNNKEVIEQSKKKLVDSKPKDSSEDGYSSGDNGSENSDTETQTNNKTKLSKNKAKPDDDFVEEIVPLRKRDENSADEGNNSDDENYLHLSEMLDSDDLGDSVESQSGDESKHESDGGDASDNDELQSDADEVYDDVEEKSGVEQNYIEHVILGGDDKEDVVLGDVAGDDKEETEHDAGLGCIHGEDNIPAPTSGRPPRPLYALILTPTRELAQQVSRHLQAVAKYTGLRIALLVGGLAAVKQERVLKAGPEIVVATPGRLWELVTQGHPHLQRLDMVRFLAIDETDRMLERGHFEELHTLLERLNVAGASQRQTFVFSATLTLVHDLPSHMRVKKVTKRGKIINRKIEKMTPQQKIKRLIDLVGMEAPKVVDMTTESHGAAASLTESRITCTRDDKDVYLYYVLRHHPARSIVFCNSIGSVRRLATLLGLLQVQVLPLHAAMPQRQRLKNLERFRDSPHGVLVATDVAARGLDIPGVEHVLQYHVPRTAENYVHRSGRTARAHREGLNVLLVEPGEAHLYAKLCRTLHKEGEVAAFPVSPAPLAALRAAVASARALDALELRRRRLRQAAGWRERAAKEMDIIIDEKDLPVPAAASGLERAVALRRRELRALLARPVLSRGCCKFPDTQPAASLPAASALQVMKESLQSGKLKKEKRTSKNAPLLKLAQGNNIRSARNKRFKHKKK